MRIWSPIYVDFATGVFSVTFRRMRRIGEIAETGAFELQDRRRNITPIYRKWFNLIFTRVKNEEWRALRDSNSRPSDS
jgi:hypothetical protein